MKKKSGSENKVRPKGKAAANNLIPFEQVQALIDVLEERGLEEFELERAGLRIRIKRQSSAPAPPPVFESYAAPAANPSVNRTGETPGAPAPEAGGLAPEIELPGEDVHLVKSPIVGTFYAAPRPDAPPFVKLGDAVEVGQVLCIIEAMKLMNEIEADFAGEIVRLYVENGQPVEYGEPLFALRPARKK